MENHCGKLCGKFFVWICLLNLLAVSPLFAQKLIGEVLDADTRKPLPYASITIEGSRKGGICNELGQFELDLPEKPQSSIVLRFSSLGYEDRRYQIEPAHLPQKLVILMQASPLSLGTVQIIGVKISPEELYLKCLNKVSDNFSQDPFLMKSFYRHYCKEDDSYGRLIEAAVDIYDEKGFRRRYRQVDAKYNLRVTQLRRSLDFTEFSYYNHLPIALNRTLSRDFAGLEVPYLRGFLREEASFSFSDTLYDPRGIVLVVQAKTRWKGGNYATDFYINMEDLALIKMEEHEIRSYFGKDYRSIRNNHFLVQYKKIGEKYFLSHLVNEGKLQSWRKTPEGKFEGRSNHEHKISWVVHDLLQEGFAPFKGREPGREELREMPFDEEFWASYSPLRSTPLENQIRRDLSRRLELERQFAEGDALRGEAGVQQQLANRTYQKFLEENRGRPKLLCFWESGNKPGPRELLTLRKLSKEFDELPVALLWINLDAEREQMMKVIRRYGLYIGVHVHHPRTGGASSVLGFDFKKSPYLILLDAAGKQVYADGKLPPYKEIKALLGKE